MKKPVLVAGAVAGVVLVGGGVAYAATGDSVTPWADSERTERGQCAVASYELNVDREDGDDDDRAGSEVSLEVQSSGPGETWQVDIDHDGTSILSGTRTTDDDGELDVDAFTTATSGTWTAEFVRTDTTGGGADETCTVTVTR